MKQKTVNPLKVLTLEGKERLSDQPRWVKSIFWKKRLSARAVSRSAPAAPLLDEPPCSQTPVPACNSQGSPGCQGLPQLPSPPVAGLGCVHPSMWHRSQHQSLGARCSCFLRHNSWVTLLHFPCCMLKVCLGWCFLWLCEPWLCSLKYFLWSWIKFLNVFLLPMF